MAISALLWMSFARSHFLNDFDFVNIIDHEAERIIGLYGDKEHKEKCQCLGSKRRLNRVFDAMGVCYADCAGPSSSLPPSEDDLKGKGPAVRRTRGRCSAKGRGSSRGRGLTTATLKSQKRKCGVQGQGPSEPADVRLGRDMAKAVGRSKKVVISKTHRFGQTSTEMVV